jgi:hypothetical protein
VNRPEVRIEWRRHADAAAFRLLTRVLFAPPESGHRAKPEQKPVSTRDTEPVQHLNPDLHDEPNASRSEDVQLEETKAPQVKSIDAIEEGP